MPGLAPYRSQVTDVRQELNRHLASGRSGDSMIALVRRTLELMESQLRDHPTEVQRYDTLPEEGPFRFTGPDLWQYRCQQVAARALYPQQADPDMYSRKYQEYSDLGLQLIQRVDMRQRAVVDRFNGRSYLIQENPLVPRIMQVIATALMAWFNQHETDADFYRRSATVGLVEMLSQRPDLVALLRLAQTLPLDTETREIPIQRPVVVEAVELAIGLVPIVGSVVAAYESYTGRDLFGYRLSNLERGILAATVLLPVAGRFVRGGRALYTEARMVSLYGRDARAWSRVMASGERVTADARALQTLQRAETTLRAGRPLERQLATDAATYIPQLVRNGSAPATAVDPAVTSLFQTLSSQYPILRSLDSPALLRILERGPNVDHLKGQLLEELIESRIVPWLRNRTGAAALGISAPGKNLEFIPGYLIRDAAGRQITDGIIGYRNNGVLEILAVFEAKAGRSAARELRIASDSLSSLSTAERTELRAFAKDVLREEREIARLQGRPYHRTVEQIEREVALSERGGQIRRDIERLDQNVDGSLATIHVGGVASPVRISPTRTKFFGILPRDVRRTLIESDLRAERFNFEIIGVDINQRDLREAADRMVSLATTLANNPL